jgi:hypothetical protein
MVVRCSQNQGQLPSSSLGKWIQGRLIVEMLLWEFTWASVLPKAAATAPTIRNQLEDTCLSVKHQNRGRMTSAGQGCVQAPTNNLLPKGCR